MRLFIKKMRTNIENNNNKKDKSSHKSNNSIISVKSNLSLGLSSKSISDDEFNRINDNQIKNLRENNSSSTKDTPNDFNIDKNVINDLNNNIPTNNKVSDILSKFNQHIKAKKDNNLYNSNEIKEKEVLNENGRNSNFNRRNVNTNFKGENIQLENKNLQNLQSHIETDKPRTSVHDMLNKFDLNKKSNYIATDNKIDRKGKEHLDFSNLSRTSKVQDLIKLNEQRIYESKINSKNQNDLNDLNHSLSILKNILDCDISLNSAEEKNNFYSNLNKNDLEKLKELEFKLNLDISDRHKIEKFIIYFDNAAKNIESKISIEENKVRSSIKIELLPSKGEVKEFTNLDEIYQCALNNINNTEYKIINYEYDEKATKENYSYFKKEKIIRINKSNTIEKNYFEIKNKVNNYLDHVITHESIQRKFYDKNSLIIYKNHNDDFLLKKNPFSIITQELFINNKFTKNILEKLNIIHLNNEIINDNSFSIKLFKKEQNVINKQNNFEILNKNNNNFNNQGKDSIHIISNYNNHSFSLIGNSNYSKQYYSNQLVLEKSHINFNYERNKICINEIVKNIELILDIKRKIVDFKISNFNDCFMKFKTQFFLERTDEISMLNSKNSKTSYLEIESAILSFEKNFKKYGKDLSVKNVIDFEIIKKSLKLQEQEKFNIFGQVSYEENCFFVKSDLNTHNKLYKEAKLAKNDQVYSNHNYVKNILVDINTQVLRDKIDQYLDPLFLDILCKNCYKCIKYEDIENHTEICYVPYKEGNEKENEFIDYEINEGADYNSKIYKLYESLLNNKNEYFSSNEGEVISIYEKLVNLIHKIFINNCSINDLSENAKKLSYLTNNEISNLRNKHKFNLLLYAQRVLQLVEIKYEEMEKILTILKLKNHEYSSSDENEIEDGNKSNKNKMKEKVDEMDDNFVEYLDTNNFNDTGLKKNDILNLKKSLHKVNYSSDEKYIDNNKNEIKEQPNDFKIDSNPIKEVYYFNDLASEYENNSNLDNSMTMSTSSRLSDLSIITNNLNMINRPTTDIVDNLVESDEERRRFFMSIAYRMKFKYSDRIKNKNLKLNDLYLKAKEENIQKEDWYIFIYTELDIE